LRSDAYRKYGVAPCSKISLLILPASGEASLLALSRPLPIILKVLYNPLMQKIKGVPAIQSQVTLFAVAFKWWGQPQHNVFTTI